MNDKSQQHFAAIAATERDSERQRIQQATQMTPEERILAGLELARSVHWTKAHWAELDRQTDGQLELARRRIALNLTQSPS